MEKAEKKDVFNECMLHVHIHFNSFMLLFCFPLPLFYFYIFTLDLDLDPYTEKHPRNYFILLSVPHMRLQRI